MQIWSGILIRGCDEAHVHGCDTLVLFSASALESTMGLGNYWHRRDLANDYDAGHPLETRRIRNQEAS